VAVANRNCKAGIQERESVLAAIADDYPMKTSASFTVLRRSSCLYVALLSLSSLRAKEQEFREPLLPGIPPGTFAVTDYGAKGDNAADNAQAIQATIDACARAGGGTVVVPKGEFLCGPIRLANRIRLCVEKGAVLRMLPLDEYPGGTKDPPDFISGERLQDVSIGGEGTIDGQGGAWWPLAKKTGVSRPRMIGLKGCERVLIEKLTLRNSPMFHIAIGGKSSDVTVRGATIRAPRSDDPVAPSHNTDACDVSGNRILIKDCDVSVGDDNFTCGGDTSNVLITHCTYGSGHGLSIGSYTKGGVSNFTVTDCTFHGTECGIRIKSDRDRGGAVSNLNFRKLRMTDVRCPILIYAAYEAKEREFRDLTKITPEIAATYRTAPVTSLTPSYRDITFSDITATTGSGRRAGLVWGLPEAPVSNVLLRNVSITADRPFGIFYAKGVRLENCRITTPEGVNKLATTNAQVEILPK
jgi:polygalacturonase